MFQLFAAFVFRNPLQPKHTTHTQNDAIPVQHMIGPLPQQLQDTVCVVVHLIQLARYQIKYLIGIVSLYWYIYLNF